MTHYGMITQAESGHLNAMMSLGYELKQRGHRVTVFTFLDGQSNVLAAGLEFQPVAESDFPLGSMKKIFTELGKLSGLAAFKYTIQWIKKSVEVNLRDLPLLLKKEGIEALIVDQVTPEGGTVAEFLDIPFISCACALMFNREISVPPINTSWNYSSAAWANIRNWMGYQLLTRITQPITEIINQQRLGWNLPPHSSPNDRYSQLAQLCQQPAEFEFPRQHLPAHFHFCGSLANSASRAVTSFPFEKLTGQPLIYASMGTIQNRLLEVFRIIAEACVDLDAQLVISLGGSATPESLPNLAGSPLVVEYAPQLELLKKTRLTITHAGMNTTMECLMNGVPMVAIPVANDQPGVASRISWSGCGESIPLKKLSISKLKTAIQKVLTEDSYKQNAVRLQGVIQQAGGVSRAADIIEQAISTGRPVLSEK